MTPTWVTAAPKGCADRNGSQRRRSLVVTKKADGRPLRDRRRPDRREGVRCMPDRPSTASSYAVFASDFRSSMLAMAHLVSTSTASPWAFIAISTSSLALVTAASYSDLAFAI